MSVLRDEAEGRFKHESGRVSMSAAWLAVSAPRRPQGSACLS